VAAKGRGRCSGVGDWEAKAALPQRAMSCTGDRRDQHERDWRICLAAWSDRAVRVTRATPTGAVQLTFFRCVRSALRLFTMLHDLSPPMTLTADDLTNSAPPALHFGRRLGRSMRRTEVSYPVPRVTTPLRTTRGSRRLVRGAQRLAALKALHFNLSIGPVEGAEWIDVR